MVPKKSGGYLIGLGRTIAHLDFDSGKTKVLHEVDKGTKNRFNDGKCDPVGRLWAGNYIVIIMCLHTGDQGQVSHWLMCSRKHDRVGTFKAM